MERGYFREEGKKLISTPLGRELYRIAPDELKKPDMTTRWWAIQEDIQQGAKPWTALPESVLESIRRVVTTEYPKVDMSLIPEQYRRRSGGTAREVLSRCPRCGGDVIAGKLGYGCANYKSGCKFVIWKKSKLPMMAKITISKSNVKTWMGGAWKHDPQKPGTKVSAKGVLYKRLQSKAGKPFEGRIYLEDDPGSAYGAGFRLVLPEKNRLTL